MLHSDAKRIVVQPEPENKASCGLLLSCGFALDTEKEVYVKTFDIILPVLKPEIQYN